MTNHSNDFEIAAKEKTARQFGANNKGSCWDNTRKYFSKIPGLWNALMERSAERGITLWPNVDYVRLHKDGNSADFAVVKVSRASSFCLSTSRLKNRFFEGDLAPFLEQLDQSIASLGKPSAPTPASASSTLIARFALGGG